MNVTIGNTSFVPMWDEVSPNLLETTPKYQLNGGQEESTAPNWTFVEPEIEIELNWIEPLALTMDGLFVVLAMVMVVFFVCAKLAARARMRWGRRFEVDMRVGAGHAGVGRVDGMNPRNVALRSLV